MSPVGLPPAQQDESKPKAGENAVPDPPGSGTPAKAKSKRRKSGVIRVDFEKGEKKKRSAWLVAAPVGFDSAEYPIDLHQLSWDRRILESSVSWVLSS